MPVAKRAFRRQESLPIRIRDALGAWYEDGDFAGAYPVRGKPGISPAQLAMVTVLQFTEDLTDRQAADAVRARVDWKYCLGLELADPGFELTVLSGFRDRLLAGGAERVIFDALLARLAGLGLVGAGGRQRTDSTHVLGRIRDLNRLELAGETVRAALEALAAAAPDWLVTVIDASWQQVYGQRIDGWRLPEGQAAREELAVQYGRDGYYLLGQVHAPGAPGWLAGLPAVRALRLIWIQQYYRDISAGGEKVIWREAAEHGLPPGADRIVSPCDLDARYSEKRGRAEPGCKVYLSERLSGDDPATGRPAAGHHQCGHHPRGGRRGGDDYPGARPDAGQRPDAGRAGGRLWVHVRRRANGRPATRHHPARLAAGRPVRAGPARRIRHHLVHRGLRPRAGYLPQRGRQQQMGPFTRGDGVQLIRVQFPARAAQDTPEFQERYRARAGVDGTIAQATHVTGIRRARYAGLDKTRLEHLAAATAINCIRVAAW